MDTTGPPPGGSDRAPSSAADWSRRRGEAVAAQAARLAAAEAEEVERARGLVAAFVAAASSAGLPTEELLALGPSGAEHRTGVRGWTLRQDRRAGVGEDGSFYLLATAPGGAAGLLARLRGVRIEPSDPPLVWGRGGRDGDSVPLAELLERRLATGDRTGDRTHRPGSGG